MDLVQKDISAPSLQFSTSVPALPEAALRAAPAPSHPAPSRDAPDRALPRHTPARLPTRLSSISDRAPALHHPPPILTSHPPAPPVSSSFPPYLSTPPPHSTSLSVSPSPLHFHSPHFLLFPFPPPHTIHPSLPLFQFSRPLHPVVGGEGSGKLNHDIRGPARRLRSRSPGRTTDVCGLPCRSPGVSFRGFFPGTPLPGKKPRKNHETPTPGPAPIDEHQSREPRGSWTAAVHEPRGSRRGHRGPLRYAAPSSSPTLAAMAGSSQSFLRRPCPSNWTGDLDRACRRKTRVR